MEKLAIYGGKPVRREVLHFVPVEANIAKEEIEAALKVLKSKKLSQLAGETVNDFEKAFAKYCAVKYAIAVNSGTSALHVALAATEIGPGDEVILPPYTFMATANAILHQNAVPIFADIDPKTYTLDPEALERTVSEKTKAVIPVHILGQPADMDRIVDVAKAHGLVVIEDCAQANGAKYEGRKVGSFGDLGCFSFYLNKNMTTGGEGGMIVTSNEELAKRARSIRNHCRPEVSPYPNVPAHNVYEAIGYNYRMLAVQAAMGLVQLRKLDKFNRIRMKNAAFLTSRIKEIEGLEPPYVRPDVKPVYWAYGARVNETKLRASRDEFAKALLAEGVHAEGYTPIPVHLQKVIRKKIGYGKTRCPFECPWYSKPIEYREGLCPNAEKLGREDLLLPVYPTLTKKDLNDTVRALDKVASAMRKR